MSFAGAERDPEPVLAPGADLAHPPAATRRWNRSSGTCCGMAGAQDERRQAARIADPEWLPFIGVGRATSTLSR